MTPDPLLLAVAALAVLNEAMQRSGAALQAATRLCDDPRRWLTWLTLVVEGITGAVLIRAAIMLWGLWR